MICLALATAATARTWFVEKDGSGDYAVIQEAVDAAADGDTIQVGQGRYDDMFSLGYPGSESIGVINLIGRLLTVIGSGEATIIGPEVYGEIWLEPYTFGVVTIDYSNTIHIESMRFEHLSYAALLGGSATMERLSVVECWRGIYLRSGGGGRIAETNIAGCFEFGFVINSGVRGYMVENLSCEACPMGVAVDGGSSAITIRNSVFTDNSTLGIQYASNASGTVQNCTVTGGRLGINVTAGSVVTIENCEMRPDRFYGLTVSNGSTVYGSRNVVHPGSIGPTIDLCSSNIRMSESHILRDENSAVEIWCIYNPELPWFIDLRNNYWGTAEADSIASWITVINDPGALTYLQYEPFYNVPVATERRSMGSVKSFFR